ncbi:MAG: hypothetical protein MRECE_12c005 [Mycoplasmataceae bacterium CE_OT135]|nr:MAG: hypothetical protein MRECE_12c005 [Mycoplasmataceae bacterium CE_OT135]
MTKTLLPLIQKSQLIIIHGPAKSGKSSLLTKLADHYQEPIFTGQALTELPTTGNIYLDDFDLALWALPNPHPEQNQKTKRQWTNFCKLARQRKQKIFLVTGCLDKLWIETKKLADLFLEIQGINNEKQVLSCQAKTKKETFELLIKIDPKDLPKPDDDWDLGTPQCQLDEECESCQ